MKKSKRHALILELIQNIPSEQILSTHDLAEQFNVSETTIRRDLQELAEQGLIQRQHGGAHSIKQPFHSHRGNVGILLGSRIDKYSDPFYNLVLEGADKKLTELGYHVAYVKTYYDIHTLAQAQELLKTYEIDGLILFGSSREEGIQYIREHYSPIVTVTDMVGVEDDTIFFDGIRGMRMMVKHLADLGHHCIGYISGQEDLRYSGFLQAINELNMEANPSLHQILTPGPAGWVPDLGKRGAKNLMEQDMKPEAIICASDRLAIGAMQWLQRNGYRVPEDVAVTGCDNIPDAEFTFPPLTTINVHKMLLGELAAERVIRRIENPDEVYLKITTPTSLIVRKSCGSKT